MGGTILEFPADKIYEAGITKGEAKGEAKGEERLAKLLHLLVSEGKNEEIARVAVDKEYRALLYEQYGID